MNDKNGLKISVVTPSYNQGEFIGRTIESVLSQNYPNLEYVVVDGGSNDRTVDVLKKYENKIKWVSEKDGGQTEAINKGFKMITGEIMAYLNSDDTYEPDTLSVVAQYFVDNPEAMIVYGKGRHVDTNDKYINDYPTEMVSLDILKNKCPICQPTVFWRRELWLKIGLFDESLQMGMDYDYWIRVARNYKFGFIDQYLANTRIHGDAKTVAEQPKVAEEMIKICQNNFGEVDDQWILNSVGEKYGPDKKNWIIQSFKLIWQINKRLPTLKTLKVYLTWVKELVNNSSCSR